MHPPLRSHHFLHVPSKLCIWLCNTLFCTINSIVCRVEFEKRDEIGNLIGELLEIALVCIHLYPFKAPGSCVVCRASRANRVGMFLFPGSCLIMVGSEKPLKPNRT
jgi:hypothetical protein